MKTFAPNYTQIPNALLDAMPELSDAELRVALAVCRQTFGWHREAAVMSQTFLARATGMSTVACSKAGSSLADKGILDKVKTRGANVFKLIVEALPEPANAVNGPANAVNGMAINAVNTNKESPEIKPSKEGGSRTSRFIGLWCTEYLSKLGQRYAAVTPRDAQAAKRFFDGNPHVEAEAVVRVARRAWEHGNPNTHWNCSRARAIAAFLNSYNEVLAEVGVAAPPDDSKYGAPGPRDFEGRPL